MVFIASSFPSQDILSWLHPGKGIIASGQEEPVGDKVNLFNNYSKSNSMVPLLTEENLSCYIKIRRKSRGKIDTNQSKIKLTSKCHL